MKRPPFVRWFGIVLRGLHLSAVIWLGAALLDGRPGSMAAAAVFASGATLFALDLWVQPSHLFEVSGASVVLKLLLVAVMGLSEALRLPLFWLLVGWSVLFAHAPASFRHRRLR